MLALLGWNDGSGQEIFSLEELIQRFDLGRVHKGGAKFDYEKAKWFNQEWIRKSSASRLLPEVKAVLASDGIISDDDQLCKIIDLVKERCTLIPDFREQAGFFFKAPSAWDESMLQGKWNAAKVTFFNTYIEQVSQLTNWDAADMETLFKALATEKSIKPGELMAPFRLMLVGGKFGPPVFQIAMVIGREETLRRIRTGLDAWPVAS
jgi:glutamyl-tRNA synthetase